MRLPFGFSLTRHKAAVSATSDGLSSLSTAYGTGRGWFPFIRESSTGAWQRNVVLSQADVLTYSTVWACITLIAADIAKLWPTLKVKDKATGVCSETDSSSFSPVLRKPNHFQTRVKFFESWMISKLVYGNTYVLKERNHRGGESRGNVVALYILDPSRVTVLVAPDGSVFYQLSADSLAGLTESSVTVPASEIIHDICVPLYHPLVGVSPIHACGLAATQGLKIQEQSAALFERGSQPSGVLTAPASISNENAERIQKHWEENYSGANNVGKVAVLGDGLHYEPMTMTAVDAELVAQMNMGDLQICATFHVPPYMVGIGQAPPYTDIQSINLQYYTQALQNPIENLECLLDEGLELPTSPEYHVEFDLNALLRMDSKTQAEVITNQIAGGYMKPNEGRAMQDRPPVDGGDSCYLQQQNYSLSALHRRDQMQPAPNTNPIATGLPSAKELGDFFRAVMVGTKDQPVEMAGPHVTADQVSDAFRKELAA